jgi:hypothetical protein
VETPTTIDVLSLMPLTYERTLARQRPLEGATVPEVHDPASSFQHRSRPAAVATLAKALELLHGKAELADDLVEEGGPISRPP